MFEVFEKILYRYRHVGVVRALEDEVDYDPWEQEAPRFSGLFSEN